MTLSPPLLDFLARHIDSVEALELLLLLKRSPETFWMPSAIESHLGMRSGTSEKRLQSLAQGELIVRGTSGGYRYHPSREEDDVRVAELATAYAEQRIALINILFSDNLARLRAFSNAFRMKGE